MLWNGSGYESVAFKQLHHALANFSKAAEDSAKLRHDHPRQYAQERTQRERARSLEYIIANIFNVLEFGNSHAPLLRACVERFLDTTVLIGSVDTPIIIPPPSGSEAADLAEIVTRIIEAHQEQE